VYNASNCAVCGRVKTDGGKGFMCTELLLTDWAVWGRGTGTVGAAILDGNLEKGDRVPYILRR
jgi:hypothetical protein